MAAQRTIGIFGGSFNPPHVAHQMLMLYVLETRDVDAVWMIPTYHHPFAKALLDFEHRCRMCELAAAALGPRVEVSRIEGELARPVSRTLETIEVLRERHPDTSFRLVIGADILSGSKGTLLRTAEDIALTHHERWDGSGYPHNTRGGDIGIEARLLGIADTFIALRSQRPHRPAMPARQALQVIREGAGQLFEPSLAEAFVDAINTYAEKEERRADASTSRRRHRCSLRPADSRIQSWPRTCAAWTRCCLTRIAGRPPAHARARRRHAQQHLSDRVHGRAALVRRRPLTRVSCAAPVLRLHGSDSLYWRVRKQVSKNGPKLLHARGAMRPYEIFEIDIIRLVSRPANDKPL